MCHGGRKCVCHCGAAAVEDRGVGEEDAACRRGGGTEEGGLGGMLGRGRDE